MVVYPSTEFKRIDLLFLQGNIDDMQREEEFCKVILQDTEVMIAYRGLLRFLIEHYEVLINEYVL